MKQTGIILSALVLYSGALCAGTELASLLVPVSELRPAEEQSPAPQAKAEPERKPAPVAAVAAPEQVLPKVTLDALMPELRSQLEAQFAPEGGLEIAPLQGWRDLTVPDAGWSVQIVRVSGQTLSSRAVVSFRILCAEASQGDFQIQVACTLKRDVLVAKKHYNKSANIVQDDFEVETRDVLELPVLPIPADTLLTGYELRNAVGAGQVLYWRDIQAKPMLKRGQVVDAIASEGALRIATKAMVLEDGREGEFISVRNLSSNKDIQARILNERTVQVYF
ncbi:MAG: flagellar basal body P-ring formation protein FlgA [Opitutales bacterium]|nr:flagellar basal body P-ring formation protein FlgA [Opitutales bacterium]